MLATIQIQSIRNLANDFEIHSPKSGVLEVVEYTENNLVFQSLARANPGQLVQLDSTIIVGDKKTRFQPTAKIISVTPGADKYFRFEVHLHQYDKPTWEAFLKVLRERQDRAEKIFDSIRGKPDS